MLSAQGMKKTHTHNLHSGSAKNILGTVSLETVTVTFKEGEVLSPHRTDQTKDTHLLTQSTDQCLEVTIQMIPLSLTEGTEGSIGNRTHPLKPTGTEDVSV